MRKALIAVAIAAVAVPVAVLLMYGGTGTPDEADPVMPNDAAPPQDAEQAVLPVADIALANATEPPQGAGQEILPEADVVPANATEPPQAADAVIHFAEDPSMLDAAVSRAAGVIGGEPAAIPDAIAAANNGFAVDFYREVSAKDGNIFFSPTSMFVAFSALYEGARGNTADQMQQVFGFEPDLQARYNATAYLMSSVNRDDQNATLGMANALWPALQFAPYDSYVDAVRSVYLADVERVDFEDNSDSGGVNRINAWASENTNGKIPKVLKQGDVNVETSMVITNSIYFKGAWVTPFSEEDTVELDFWKNSTESVRADFMYISEGEFDYASLDGIKIIRMPYNGDRLSMLVILPNGRDGIGSLEETISAGQIEQWTQSMRKEKKVMLLMPKFTMGTSYNLSTYLKNLGMTDAFDRILADLSGIAPVTPDRNLYVYKAVHKAYVDVNEGGTEAAAATAVVLATTSGPKHFIAKHPFIFIIQDDESGAILFMGRLSDPTA